MAAAQAQLEAELENPFFQQEIERCEEAMAAGGSDEFPAGFNCEDRRPQLEWFIGYSPPSFVTEVRSMVPAAVIMLALAAGLIGATFAGAEWAAGTIGTQLVFQPRRGLVFAAKAGALAIGLSTVAAIVIGAAFVVAWWTASSWGSTELVATEERFQPDGGSLAVEVPVTTLDLAGLGLRGMSVVAIAGLGGFVLAMAFRSSLAAIGTAFAYAVVGEGLLRALWTGAEPWLASNRLAAWLMGDFEIITYPDCGPREACEPLVRTLSLGDGAVYLSLALTIGLAASYVLFRRRDVT
jgi:ABC-2 type transport system permease protein